MSTKTSPSSSIPQEIRAEAVDEIDLAILRVLQRKGRATNDEVGDAVGLSPSAASRRIHTLESRGIIIGYQALVENKVLGAAITVFVRVTLESQTAAVLQAFEAAIKRCNSVTSCHLMAGQYDYMLQVKIANITDYERVHQQELSRFPGVKRIESSFAVRDVIEREIGL